MRIAANSVLVLGAFMLPWWAFLLLIFAAFTIIPFFYEGILFAALIDFLYASPLGLNGVEGAYMLITFCIFIVVELVRSRIRSTSQYPHVHV